MNQEALDVSENDFDEILEEVDSGVEENETELEGDVQVREVSSLSFDSIDASSVDEGRWVPFELDLKQADGIVRLGFDLLLHPLASQEAQELWQELQGRWARKQGGKLIAKAKKAGKSVEEMVPKSVTLKIQRAIVERVVVKGWRRSAKDANSPFTDLEFSVPNLKRFLDKFRHLYLEILREASDEGEFLALRQDIEDAVSD